MTKFNTSREARMFMQTFDIAARVVAGEEFRYDFDKMRHTRVPTSREWFALQYRKYRIHPAIFDMFMLYRPDDWHQLLLEWPHKAETDPNRLAYTRDERSGEADRQTVTTIGKYLTRHFSSAPDYVIRDIVAQHTYAGQITYTNDRDTMVCAVVDGPASCMSKTFLIHGEDGHYYHPYAVYDPELGWGMVIRKDGDEVLGRCLVWTGEEAGEYVKHWVRSYKREKNERSHSGSDEAIEMWLKANGYTRQGSWDGKEIKEVRTRDGDYLMPYIDGNVQRVELTSRGMFINDDGDIDATNTGGTSSYGRDICAHCGARYNSEDAGIWIGAYEDEHVCGNCEDNYTYVYGRRGNQYYINNDRVIEADGDSYDCEYLSDNNIVELANGDYTHIDNAVWIESEDAYYDSDDSDICYAEDSGRYEMTADCWQCEATNNWYTDDTDYVEIDGCKYHPDDAPEVEEEGGNNA